MTEWLARFVAESNKIEGIHRPPTDDEIQMTQQFVLCEAPNITALENLVSAFQPGAILRDQVGLDVRVGGYLPPRGGPKVREWLAEILGTANSLAASPWHVHCTYEQLHPFTDGNGRSGRALWLWMMTKLGRDAHALQLGFLHTFYYQTLANLERED